MKSTLFSTTILLAVSLASANSLYAQCGGQEYTGSTECSEGTCVEFNPYYSQCVPSAATTTSDAEDCDATEATSSPVARASGVAALYGQCGGMNWAGPTECAAPATCVYSNDWYSQCLISTGAATSSTKAATTTAAVTTAKTSTSSRSVVLITSTVTASPSSKATTSTVSSKAATTSVASSTKPATTATPATSSRVLVASSSSSSSSAAPVQTAASTGFLAGVNMAGYDFSVYTDGSASGSGQDPPVAQFSHFASEGVNVFRIPFAWQFMQPTLGGTIDSSFFARYDATVQTALSQSTKPYVILDLHNYARFNGAIVGQGGPTNDQFANIWSQLAAKYKDEPRIIFGLMNEPHDISISPWVTSVQTAVNAIRAAGATSQTILIPGSTWSHASALPTEAGPSLLAVKDTDGSVDKLIFDVHQYLDSDGSGTNTECVTDNVSVFTTLATWLKSNGGRKAFLSETGGGNTASCEKYFASELAFIKQNSDAYLGFTVWSAGSFDTSYALSVTPNGNTDSALWTAAVKPLL